MGELAKNFMNLLDSSEMFCSLKYESVAGCPYNAFTRRDIALLSCSSALCAVVSLLVGM